MRNSPISETSMLDEACQAIRQRLPPGWDLTEQLSSGKDRLRFDGALVLADPQGLAANIAAEVKRRPVEARDVSILADRWARVLPSQTQETQGSDGDAILMVVAPFLGPSAKDRLAEAGISFADATGNIRLVSSRPAVFIEAFGSTPKPLAGEPASSFPEGKPERPRCPRVPGLLSSLWDPRTLFPDRECPRVVFESGRPAATGSHHSARALQGPDIRG